jgi:hypothetical protein
MDLQSARKHAEKDSKAKGKTLYINLKDGECVVSETPDKDNENVMAGFSKGREIPISDEPKTTKTNETLAKLSNKARGSNSNTKPAKEKAEKIIPVKSDTVEADTKIKTKEVMAKVEKKNGKGKAAAKPEAKVKSKEAGVPRGNNMVLTASQWKKVDAKVGESSWSGWVRDLVKKAAGIAD